MGTTEGHGKGCVPGMGHDRLLPLYDPLHRLGMVKVHRPLVDQAGIRPGHRVLEIGCGTGNLALLAKRLHPDAEVVGLDPDPNALARAKRKAEREGLAVRFDRGFAEDLPYPDASFDLVLSAFMFHHLGPDEKEEALGEARRVLRPGGSLHLLDKVEARESSAGLVPRRFNRSRVRHGHERGVSGERVKMLMREAGFADAAEVAWREKRGLGRVAYYRATVPRVEPGVARHGAGPGTEIGL